MVANLSLLLCAFVTAQTTDRSEILLVPRLSRGQELVYRGNFAEESTSNGVQFKRSYRMESRVFVLDTAARGAELAIFTAFKLRSPRTDSKDESMPASVRLELATLDSQGRLRPAPGSSLVVALDGPATIEAGVFVESPEGGKIQPNQSWQTTEDKRPVRTWRFLGNEVVNEVSCLKLEAVQQSDDWDKPRADRAAWRRRDTLWINPRLGVAYKVERTIERREAAHRDPTQRSVVQYELQSNIQYPGKLYEDRKREILQAKNFGDQAAPLLPNPTKQPPRLFDAMLAKMSQHLDNHPPTPYRDAVIQVKRRVEAARRGESPPLLDHPQEETVVTMATLGQKAPDFIVPNLLTRESTRLYKRLGQPILMVFYSPNSPTAEEVLRFCDRIQRTHEKHVLVLGFAVADDINRIRAQHNDLHLTFPILSGKGLRQSYAVDATPKLIVIDGDGVVRGNYPGWGPETAVSISGEIKRWLRPIRPVSVPLPGAPPASRP